MWIPHAGIIPYCIRSVGLPSNLLVNNEKHVIHGTSITFETLQRENITSQQLYLLSAPIDVIERYQAFLENSQSSVSTQIFNNCSELWFGEYCQYSFNLTLSFYDIVRAYLFHMSLENDKLSKNETCYTFIECNRGPPPSCIDWREICDGKIDCLDDGRDEVDCEQLHMNECKEDEFRCSNGFCIPKEFFNDEPDYPDCIDRSDEQIDGSNYTDEMNCQDWPCNNAYTRCDGKWNCRNAVDEANCSDNPCRPDGHPCILPQPKDANQTYYIRIDIYNKEEKEYCVSIFYPIQYSFLPVHRLSLQVSVPIREVAIKSKKCPLKCLHGRCRHFWNSDKYFCQCSDGYSGILCTMKNSCDCSSDSICVEVVNNRSICVCPLDKFGPRCYLKRTLCNSNSCSDNGRCIVGEEKISETEHYCLCSQGYMGSRCEKSERKIEFLFVKTILLPQTIFIHFIDIPAEYSVPSGQAAPDPTQITMISKLKFHENSTFVYYGGRFHLIFVEFYQNYYLALLQHNSTLPMNISTTIIPEHRCLSINELLPDHIQKLSQWNRAKHYHIPCQNHTNLACFYDNDYFMCLCDIDRYANCFKFNYHPAHNCLGYNYCENDGQCYVDNRTCPTTSACLCKECYYGGRCQFTTTGFGLSLDDILSYNIWPNVPFTRQPTVVKISTGLTTIMFGIAIINAIASIITFQTKQSLQIGAGLYLLASSITSCITMTMFTLKFLLLLLSQMSIITNDSFLLLNCICTDLFLKSFSVVGEWLSACVNIERVLAVRLGVKFNKTCSTTWYVWFINSD
ncbi:unnamed protein product [Rotaria sp. Silwood1]|nr:unnamed protein product [Rotaria sp. Silwood1]